MAHHNLNGIVASTFVTSQPQRNICLCTFVTSQHLRNICHCIFVTPQRLGSNIRDSIETRPTSEQRLFHYSFRNDSMNDDSGMSNRS